MASAQLKPKEKSDVWRSLMLGFMTNSKGTGIFSSLHFSLFVHLFTTQQNSFIDVWNFVTKVLTSSVSKCFM